MCKPQEQCFMDATQESILLSNNLTCAVDVQELQFSFDRCPPVQDESNVNRNDCAPVL